MATNVFDQAARYSVRSDPLGFLRWVVRGLDPALRFLGWLDTRTVPFPGTRDRTCDTVAELAAAAEAQLRWAIIIEFQTEPDPAMLVRLLEYLVRLHRGLRSGPDQCTPYQVVGALVSLTGPAQPDTLKMALPGLASPALQFSVAVRTLRDEDAAVTLEEIAAGTASRSLLGWISLMQGGAEPGIIDRWKQVAGQEPNVRHNAEHGAIATVFAELTNCAGIWKSALEGWNMRESTIVAEWKAEGRAEGRAEGMAEGIAKGKRSALLEVLEQRFGAPVDPELVAAIERQADIDVLSRWFKSALKAETLEAFRAELAGRP